MSPKKLLVVDCDCGIDDALALLLALAHKETWKLLAITCCYGNSSVDNACNNVRKVLQFCNETQIPVYRGSERPLIRLYDGQTYHGNDGFGNVGHEYPHDRIPLADGLAANALVDLAKTYNGEIHLIILGPMTNIATALRLDPDFTKNLKSIHFMGGNITALGNTTSAAEFNFFVDPEAANIVAAESKCPITMIPWETTLNHGMTWDDFEQWMTNNEGSYVRFIEHISKDMARMCKEEGMGYVDCDFMAMVCLISPFCIKNTEKYPISVETSGNFTKGQVVVERRLPSNSKRQALTIVTALYDSVLNDFRISTPKTLQNQSN